MATKLCTTSYKSQFEPEYTSMNINKLKTKVSTYSTKSSNGYAHVHVNHPDETRRELNSTIKQVLRK